MKIEFKWIGAACFILEVEDQLKIGCDPCLSPKGTTFDFKFFKSERKIGPEYEDIDFKDVDVWLLTHGHEDHLDDEGLAMMDDQSIKLCHQNMEKKLVEKGMKKIDPVKWGDVRKIKNDNLELTIQVVPAIHGSNFITSYFAGGVNGYWLKLTSGEENKDIYITGDTVCHPELEKKIGNKICDVLIPNMGAVKSDHFGGPLTLNSDMLSHMIDCFEPLKVLPVHYGDFSHYYEGFPELDLSRKKFVSKTQRGKKVELNI